MKEKNYQNMHKSSVLLITVLVRKTSNFVIVEIPTKYRFRNVRTCIMLIYRKDVAFKSKLITINNFIKPSFTLKILFVFLAFHYRCNKQNINL